MAFLCCDLSPLFAARADRLASQKTVENTVRLLNREPINRVDHVPISLIDRTDLDQAPAYCPTG